MSARWLRHSTQVVRSRTVINSEWYLTGARGNPPMQAGTQHASRPSNRQHRVQRRSASLVAENFPSNSVPSLNRSRHVPFIVVPICPKRAVKVT